MGLPSSPKAAQPPCPPDPPSPAFQLIIEAIFDIIDNQSRLRLIIIIHIESSHPYPLITNLEKPHLLECQSGGLLQGNSLPDPAAPRQQPPPRIRDPPRSEILSSPYFQPFLF